MNDIESAIQLAAKYHSYQYRSSIINGQKMPFLIHPLEVCKKVWEWGVGDESIMIAAILHDVVEDTVLSVRAIESQFGPQIAKIVEELTFKPDPEISKEEKIRLKAEYIASFKDKSPQALVIKMADRLINVMDLYLTDRDRAYRYYHKADALYAVFKARIDELMLVFGDETVAAIAESYNKVTSIIHALNRSPTVKSDSGKS